MLERHHSLCSIRAPLARPGARSLALAALGVWSFQRLPIDAVPDITNVQVQINTEAPGYSPLEAEQRITFPIETAIAGLPRLDYTRSLSRYGLSQVTVVFEDGTDIYFARQLRRRAPAGGARAAAARHSSRELGPIATGLGEIFMYTVEAEPGARKPDGTPGRPTDLRTVQDWVIRPQLRTVPGVTEVNTIGGYERQFHVTPRPGAAGRLRPHLARRRRARSKRNNANVGAGYIERNGEQYLVRVPGQVADLDDLRRHRRSRTRAACRSASRDVADVGVGQELRTGAATAERRGGRARHGLHADRREQPRPSSQRRRREAGGDRRARLPAGVVARRRSTTAPTLVDAHDRHGADEPARRRAAGRSWCCSCCSATSARRSITAR